MGKRCKSQRLGAGVLFVAITTLLLMVIACTPSSLPTSRAPVLSTPVPLLEPTLSVPASRAPVQNTPADLEREAIISFTSQALEIEAKRNELIAYFAGLRDSVGIHGQALAIERFFSNGVPGTLRDAPPSGFEGMTSLRNRFLLLDSPQPTQHIKDAFLRVYDSEIQQALNQTKQNQADWGAPTRQLVYPEISGDSLNYWRTLADQSEGATKTLYKYKIETDWFGIQELRQQIYGRWDDTLKEQGIDVAEAGITLQIASEPDYHQIPGSDGEEAYGPYAIFLNVAGIPGGFRTSEQSYELRQAQPLHDIFRIQQRVGLFPESGVTAEPDWATYAQARDLPERIQKATRILSGILVMTPAQRERAGVTFEPGGPGDIEDLQLLLSHTLIPRFGRYGATFQSDRMPTFWTQRWLQQNTGGTPLSFIDYLAVEGYMPSPATTWGQIASLMDRDTIMGLADTWFPTGSPQPLSDSQEAKLRAIFVQAPLGQTDFETWYKLELKRAFQTAQ